VFTISINIQSSGTGTNDNDSRGVNVPDETDPEAVRAAFEKAQAFLDVQKARYAK
jgi:hypothetical protein